MTSIFSWNWSKNHSRNKLNRKQQLLLSSFDFIIRNMGQNTHVCKWIVSCWSPTDSSLQYNFQNHTCCEKDLKDSKHNSLHLVQKMLTQVFVLEHYLFSKLTIFLEATLMENCLLLRTDYVLGQISWHIFAPNRGLLVSHGKSLPLDPSHKFLQ